MQEFIGVISCSSQAGWKTREINENKTGLRIRYREMLGTRTIRIN